MDQQHHSALTVLRGDVQARMAKIVTKRFFQPIHYYYSLKRKIMSSFHQQTLKISITEDYEPSNRDVENMT